MVHIVDRVGCVVQPCCGRNMIISVVVWPMGLGWVWGALFWDQDPICCKSSEHCTKFGEVGGSRPVTDMER